MGREKQSVEEGEREREEEADLTEKKGRRRNTETGEREIKAEEKKKLTSFLVSDIWFLLSLKPDSSSPLTEFCLLFSLTS